MRLDLAASSVRIRRCATSDASRARAARDLTGLCGSRPQRRRHDMNAESKHFAVFGHPIAHSLSPRIHARFAALRGIALRYVAIDAPLETFAAQLAGFAAGGGNGANVTLPLKQAALGLCAQVSDFARR